MRKQESNLHILDYEPSELTSTLFRTYFWAFSITSFFVVYLLLDVLKKTSTIDSGTWTHKVLTTRF